MAKVTVEEIKTWLDNLKVDYHNIQQDGTSWIVFLPDNMKHKDLKTEVNCIRKALPRSWSIYDTVTVCDRYYTATRVFKIEKKGIKGKRFTAEERKEVNRITKEIFKLHKVTYGRVYNDSGGQVKFYRCSGEITTIINILKNKFEKKYYVTGYNRDIVIRKQ